MLFTNGTEDIESRRRVVRLQQRASKDFDGNISVGAVGIKLHDHGEIDKLGNVLSLCRTPNDLFPGQLEQACKRFKCSFLIGWSCLIGCLASTTGEALRQVLGHRSGCTGADGNQKYVTARHERSIPSERAITAGTGNPLPDDLFGCLAEFAVQFLRQRQGCLCLSKDKSVRVCSDQDVVKRSFGLEAQFLDANGSDSESRIERPVCNCSGGKERPEHSLERHSGRRSVPAACRQSCSYRCGLVVPLDLAGLIVHSASPSVRAFPILSLGYALHFNELKPLESHHKS